MLTLLIAVVPATPQTATGTVQGRVETPAGDPIANARVEMMSLDSMPAELAGYMQTLPPKIQVTPPLIDEAGRVESAATPSDRRGQRIGFSATTDATGRFVIGNVPGGRYSLQARTTGYFSSPAAGVPGIAGVFISWFEIRGNEVVDLALQAVKGGIVSGRVTSVDGRPTPGVTIAAFKREYGEDGRVLFTSSVSRTSDDRGEYRLFDLAPGEYKIALSDPGSSRLRMIQDPDTAISVLVTEGVERNGVNLTPTAPPTFRVSGRVTFPAAESVTPANSRVRSFYLVPLDARLFTDHDAPTFTNTSEDRATFQIAGVPPGSYELMSFPTNALRFLGRAFIEVPMGNVDNVSITLGPNVDVKARLVYVGGAAPSGAAPNLQLQPRERYRAPLEAVRAFETPKTDESGAIVFSRVPQGRYTFQVAGLEPNAYIGDIRESGRSVFDEGFVIADTPASVEVLVDLAGETVTGTLRDGEQKPVALERVVLVPEQARRHNHALFKTVLTDASGRFVFRGVAPGNYKVLGWAPSPQPNAHMNAEFLARHEALAQPVQVTKAYSGELTVAAIQR